MSAKAGQWDDDEIDGLLDGESTGGDSELVRNLRAALRAQTKARKEAEAEVNGFKTTTRKSTLTELLKARELDPKVAAFIPADVEATEDGVGKWLDEYGDVFGAKKPETQQQQQSSLTDEQIAAMRQMDVVTSSASSTVNNDLLRSIQNAETPEALIAMIHAAGGQG
jgi:hypothetical protein